MEFEAGSCRRDSSGSLVEMGDHAGIGAGAIVVEPFLDAGYARAALVDSEPAVVIALGGRTIGKQVSATA